MTNKRPYHDEAVRFLLSRKRAALWIGMGGGKTRIVIDAAVRAGGRVLVLAPNALVRDDVWARQLERWVPTARVCVIKAGAQTDRQAIESADFVVSTYKLADSRGLPALAKLFNVLILDESSVLENPRSLTTKTALALARKIPCVFELTGTPAADDLMGLWSQISLLRPGLLGRLGEFRQRWFIEKPIRVRGGRRVSTWTPKPNAERDLAKFLKLAGVVFAVDQADVADIVGTVGWEHELLRHKTSQEAAAAAHSIVQTGVAHVDGYNIVAPDQATRVQKSLQLAAGFVILDEDRVVELDRCKFNAALNWAKRNTPCFVVCAYRYAVQQWRDAGAAVLTADNLDLVDAWNAGKIDILVANYRSVSHGIELQHGGRSILFYNAIYSNESWHQAVHRLVRPGQIERVHVCEAVAANSIEEIIATQRRPDKQLKQRELLKLVASSWTKR